MSSLYVPGLMRMTAGLSRVVVCGTALMASWTVLYCPLPSAATTSVVCAARASATQNVRQTSKPTNKNLSTKPHETARRKTHEDCSRRFVFFRVASWINFSRVAPPRITSSVIDSSRSQTHGQIVRELRLLVLLAGSMLTLRKEIEPAFCNISAVSTPRKSQSTKRTSSMTAPGQLAIHITRGLDWLRTFCNSTFLTTGL